MNLSTSKTLGGVGALLMVLTPFLGVYTVVLGLVGLILVMTALKGLSDYYKEGGIFNNGLYGVIIAIIGIVIAVTAIVMTLVDLLTELGIDLATAWSDPTFWESINFQELVTWDIVWPHVAAVIGTLVALFVFLVVAAIFLRKSLTILSEKTGVGLFATTGLLTLIGAILPIVGLLLLWIALILLTVSFFSIKITTTQATASTSPPPPE